MEDCPFDIWEQNLELIDRYSLCIDAFSFSDKNFQKLTEHHRDKLARLQIYQFLFPYPEYEISEEDINIIREMNPAYIVKFALRACFHELKNTFSTNSANINIVFENIEDSFVNFKFWNSHFLLFDSINNQNLFFEFESVNLDFDTKGFDKMHLVKTDKDNHEVTSLKIVLNRS